MPATLRRCLRWSREQLGWPGLLGLACLAVSLALLLARHAPAPGPAAADSATATAPGSHHVSEPIGQRQELAQLLALAQQHRLHWLRSELQPGPAPAAALQLTLQGAPEQLKAFTAELTAVLPDTRVELLELSRTASTAPGDLQALLRLTFSRPLAAPAAASP